MKKKVLLIAAIFVAGTTFAQDQLTSKKGVPILPEAGDYAIGFDAANLINFAGNLLNSSAGNSLNNLNLQGDQMTITGKQFVSADKAYRGMLRIGFTSSTNRGALAADGINAVSTGVENDEFKSTNINIAIGGAIEMRRGNGRLQGFYGPVGMITFASTSSENTYDAATPGAGSLLELKSGSTIGLNVGGLAGVEYFFAPKVSVGAEIMWTLNFTTQGDGEATSADGTGGSVTGDTFGSTSFGVDTRPNGIIALNFHF